VNQGMFEVIPFFNSTKKTTTGVVSVTRECDDEERIDIQI
jgi:hypothetical protein